MEFLECAGYRLMLPDCSRLSNAVCPEMLRTLTEPDVRRSRHTTITSLADSPHGSSVMICSNCAFRSHVSNSGCIWQPQRILPLCRECSQNPPAHMYNFKLEHDRPSIAENIRKFSGGESYYECDCYEAFSPKNGFHLCSGCSALFHCTLAIRRMILLYNHVSFVSASSAGICDFPDEPEFTSRSARNNCPCGKTWPELLSSWEGLSEAERKEKIYRICLFCTGHVRHKEMFTTVPTNCI